MIAEASASPGKTLAEHYVAIALKIIDLAHEGGNLSSPKELRSWWSKERDHRELYGVSEEQEQILIEACAAKVKELNAETDDSSRKPNGRRSRAAI